ncbi:Sterol O-acyltransferase 2 [Daldinia childiae]|uniref:Sterol O-acyltransferase 2 n=1 Tax=Daldinia childiae TaxID=326645 RepID=UPI001445665F|nr:Sterol O-acyltransferase 2 [Daldinia childiae]KAF3058022.1 Sterol O-acyltransferase 2 [Daldinia childiae]
MSTEELHATSQSRDHLATDTDIHSVHSRRETQHPVALAEALKAVHRIPDTPSDSNSDSGIEATDTHPQSVLLRRKPESDSYDNSASETPEILHLESPGLKDKSSSEQLLHGLPKYTSTSKGKKAYVVASDDAELREILRRGLERLQEKEKELPGRREKLRDMVFTRQFSAFDRQNQDAANSPFHGFYVLFWISVFFLIVKMAADNWRKTGNPLGTNEIMKAMFKRDVIVLLFSDGIMCALTGVSWVIQRLVFLDYIDWKRSGWILQNIWQTLFIASAVGLTLVRDWPWTHTVFFVLHGLVMLMKQHSYAFYNGHLSSLYKKRQSLLLKLKQLENISPVTSPSQTRPRVSALSTSHLAHPPSADEYRERRVSLSKTGSTDQNNMESISCAIEAAEPLDIEQIHVFERLIKWEVDALADELRGKAKHPTHYYPNNLTFLNHYEYIVLPTVVYELQYPRSERINWYYVAEKTCALFGVIFVMIMISQAFIYPVVMRTIHMKEIGLTTTQRFREFPWILSDLAFPFMMEYMLAWYLIWETVLNILAELTFFADRSFYDTWWNSVSWDQYARDWNRPVHNFLLRHVYHSSISSMRVNKHTATLITFFLSACVHELVMWCIFKKLRGYLLILQMSQLPLVRLSRTKWLRGQPTVGNIIFWVGIFTGPSLLCSLYLIL